MNHNTVCKMIAKELEARLKSKDPIINDVINEEVLRDISCKTIFDDYISNGGKTSYAETFSQEVPYSNLKITITEGNFDNIKNIKLDSYAKLYSHAEAIEFKCNIDNNKNNKAALPERTGLLFNDLFRLYQIYSHPFEHRYLIYLTDNKIEKYAQNYYDKRNKLFPLIAILDADLTYNAGLDVEKIIITSDDLNKYSPCKTFVKAATKSFKHGKNLETVVQRVAHESINNFKYNLDLYILEVFQNPKANYAKAHKGNLLTISEAEGYFKTVILE